MDQAECDRRHKDLEVQIASIKASQVSAAKDIAEIKVAIVGDIGEKQEGLLHRVRELERSEKTRSGIIVTCITTAVIAVASAIWSALTGR